jgi:hypothetical protein
MLKKIEMETDENFQKRKDEKERLKNVVVSTPAKSRKNIKGLEFLLSPIAPKEKSWSGDSTFYIPPLNPKKARVSKAKKPKRSDLQQGPKKRKTQPSIPVINEVEHVDRVPAISEKSPEIRSGNFLPIRNGLKTYSRRLKSRPVETSNSFSLLEVAEDPAREKVPENDDRKIDQVSTRKSARRTRSSIKQPKSPDPHEQPSLPKQSLDLFDLIKNQEDGEKTPNPVPEKSSENTKESSNPVPLKVASPSNNPPRSLLKRKTESLPEIEDRITMRKSNRKRSKLSAMEEIVEESEVGVPASAILKSFGVDIPVEPIKFITTRKPKKSVAIRICPDIMEISDSSLTSGVFSGSSRKSSLMPTTQINGLENQIKLHPGKWRKSLAAYKKSMACDNNQRGITL